MADFQTLELSASKVRSQVLTGDPGDQPHWVKRSGARAHLRAAGFKNEDFTKPIITVACPYSNALPCNNHFQELSQLIVKEVEQRGGKAFVCGTPVVSDGETMGSAGMRYSLISRDWIADCVEIMHEAYAADAIIALGGCDKTVPGVLMPLARLDSVSSRSHVHRPAVWNPDRLLSPRLACLCTAAPSSLAARRGRRSLWMPRASWRL